MAFAIRKASELDLPLLGYMNRCLIEDEGSQNPMSDQQLEQRMGSWLQEEWRVELFVEGHIVVGYTVYQLRQKISDLDQKLVYIRQFYIQREQRGRGLGRLAFETLSQTRFPAGAMIEVDVLSSNPAGYRFWSKVGLRPYCTTMRL